MTRFEQFTKERRYLGNVSERSIEWYDQAFRWLPNDNPTEADLKHTIIRMREGGMKPRSINFICRFELAPGSILQVIYFL